MFDERAFIARVEAADADELIRVFARPSVPEEGALRAYFGDDRYRRLHGTAVRRASRRALQKPKGNVVVIHGIMGGELNAVGRDSAQTPVWLSALNIIRGRLTWLRLSEDGRSEHGTDYDVRVSGVMKRHYGELLLSLSESWTVRAFWFDWRKDLKIAAAELEAQISGWFDDDAPVHIVAHSMGGLVARTFIKSNPRRWGAMWDKGSSVKGRSGGRLVMLGTPNHGSFAIPQVMTGAESTVKKLARLDLRNDLPTLLKTLNSFVGSYQMLPSPFAIRGIDRLYKAETYSDLNISQRHLDNALEHHKSLRDVVDLERMVYVAGSNQPTYCGIKDFEKLNVTEGYEITTEGDGRVPHALGLLRSRGGRVKTYYVNENHGDLPANASVLGSLDELLETGSTSALTETAPRSERGAARGAARYAEARGRLTAAQSEELEEVERLRVRLASRAAEPALSVSVNPDERRLEELVTRGFLSYRDEEEGPGQKREAPFRSPKIEVALVCDAIERIGKMHTSGPPVDAICVGHYLGVKAQSAELALDNAISCFLPGAKPTRAGRLSESDRLLTQYSERGIIRGDLGQPFFLSDPRQSKEKRGNGPDRVIVVAGMGVPSRFGIPEVTVLAREVCWSLGRLGKRHLATVLIGAGKGNLSIRDAVGGWIRGIKNAITGSIEDAARHLVRVTFVEIDPRKIKEIQEAIRTEADLLTKAKRLEIEFRSLSDEKLESLKKGARRRQAEEFDRLWKREEQLQQEDRIATRVTVAIERKVYRFGAITENASIPEREIPLDPKLVMDANDELAAESIPARQLERGQLLERLLIPESLRPQIYTGSPLVMLLDSTTARIHWEMLAQAELMEPKKERPRGLPQEAGEGAGGNDVDYHNYFLATSRGFTRQLRSTFAPPPEPPPPPRRILRVLVVADPAEDAPLVGAEQEGIEVADLFEKFNAFHERDSLSRVDVVRLFGPREATRTNVLRELMLHSYDVLHFAGHCQYVADSPSSSGWIFTGGELLSANEFSRIDRIPKFVFSNACESGITPDRSELRSVDLAPSFAEAFFARGVSNFVCTAWPVDDAAARSFALMLYARLLALPVPGFENEPLKPMPMHIAMRDARLSIADTSNGARTWGAYQHYGNPYLRFFDPDSPAPKRERSAPGKRPHRRGVTPTRKRSAARSKRSRKR
ncbi:MAG: CHAT domain-containing protein [Acidobacteriota bacterium]|nr:CHAT domain-containing protein [Acidobacteriota bacterium]